MLRKMNIDLQFVKHCLLADNEVMSKSSQYR